MTTDGELIGLDAARAAPLRCAGANWMATALMVARIAPDAILVDCGGTTTDVIPIAGGVVAARGRTDVERLLRASWSTPARCGPTSPRWSRRCRSAASRARCLRSCSRSAPMRTCCCGNLTPEQCTCSFPDGRGSSAAEVRSRLARVVCADPEQLADGDLEAIADAVQEAQVASIARALARVAARVPGGRAGDRGRRRRVPGPGGGGAVWVAIDAGRRVVARR